jgi:hypothetical protein
MKAVIARQGRQRHKGIKRAQIDPFNILNSDFARIVLQQSGYLSRQYSHFGYVGSGNSRQRSRGFGRKGHQRHPEQIPSPSVGHVLNVLIDIDLGMGRTEFVMLTPCCA